VSPHDSGKAVFRVLPALAVLFSLPLDLLVAVADPVGLALQSMNPKLSRSCALSLC
jgi:hypothetical protein